MSTPCVRCQKAAYPTEKKVFGGRSYHNWCFQCKACLASLTLTSAAKIDDDVFCPGCYDKAFKATGRYDKLSENAALLVAQYQAERDAKAGVNKSQSVAQPAAASQSVVATSQTTSAASAPNPTASAQPAEAAKSTEEKSIESKASVDISTTPVETPAPKAAEAVQDTPSSASQATVPSEATSSTTTAAEADTEARIQAVEVEKKEVTEKRSEPQVSGDAAAPEATTAPPAPTQASEAVDSVSATETESATNASAFPAPSVAATSTPTTTPTTTANPTPATTVSSTPSATAAASSTAATQRSEESSTGPKSIVAAHSRRFSSIGDATPKCSRCNLSVYPMEKTLYDGVAYHKSCFTCLNCKQTLSPLKTAKMDGKILCKTCFMRLFKGSGRYDFINQFNSDQVQQPE